MRTGRLTFTECAGLCLLMIASIELPVWAAPQKAQPVSPAPEASAPQEADKSATFDNLEIVDASLKGKLAVSRVGSQLADNNLLSVFAGFKNKTGKRLTIEVETIYKDKAGNPLNAASWISLTLPANEERDYRSSSITEEATDFLIRVRRAKGVAPGHK